MNVVLRHALSVDEFLAWEARQELKHEFDGAGPVAMAGGTRNHARLQVNITTSMATRLRGKPCEFLGSDMKVVMDRTVRYPDGQVVCSPGAGKDTMTRNPTVLFEVLSDSTQSVDRLNKNREYRAIPSLQRYVMLEQDRIAATVHARAADGWMTQILFAGDTLAMPEIGVDLPLDELYEGLDLAAALAG